MGFSPRRRATPGAAASAQPSAASTSITTTTSSPIKKKRTELSCKTVSLRQSVCMVIGCACWFLYIYSASSFDSNYSLYTSPIPNIEYRSHPIQVQYDVEDNVVSQTRATFQQLKPAAKGFMVKNDDSYDEKEQCIPMHDWQTSMFPSCNSMHEIDMFPKKESFLFVNCGGDRCAFQIISNTGRPVALKVQKFSRDFDPKHYEYARKDGVSMERLSASPYFVDLFSYCGMSQVLEFGSGGNLHDLIKLSRKSNDQNYIDPVDRLKIGIQIVSAVADLHSFEKDGIPSLAHNDLCCHQFILVNGIYKLNDFHLAQFLKKDRHTNQTCTGKPYDHSKYSLLHSPEELKGHFVLNEYADDYMAGNVMYYVLTKKWLYEDVHGMKEAYALLEKGITSKFPSHILNSQHAADKAMVKAIQMLWTRNPEKRPSSRKVSNYLLRKLQQLQGDKDDVIRVDNIPPLPTNHRYTDSDFDRNLS